MVFLILIDQADVGIVGRSTWKLRGFEHMPIPDDKVRLQTIVDRKLARKIESMAGRLGVGQSRMIYYLLDAALQDEAWIAQAIPGTFAKRVRSALRK